MRDVVTVLIDCGLRPEECFRLTWQDSIRVGASEIHTGKGRGSRRRIPASQRVLGVLEEQHAAALTKSKVAPFVLYTFRHTCITRWAKHMDPFTLHVLAGHTDMNTTKRYVHPSEADILEAMEKVRGGQKTGHNPDNAKSAVTRESSAIQ